MNAQVTMSKLPWQMRRGRHEWRDIMEQNCTAMPEEPRDSFVEVDIRDRTSCAVNCDSATTLGYNARQETERFINGHICDPKQGWPRVRNLLHRPIT
jgi:hypothetical protein